MGRRLRSDPRLQELEAIYREHHRRIRWVLRSRGVGDDALDDLVQEAFVAIFRRLPDRDPDLPMAVWVSGIARNVAFSHRRSSARRIEASRKLPPPTTEIEPDEAVERRRAWGQLQTFLDGLDEGQREVFVLSDLLGMKVPEVADVVDAPLNTLYSRLRLARRRFTDRFGDDGRVLDRAGQGEAPTSSQRRQAWLAIAAQLPVVAAPAAATGTTTFVGLKWLLALGAAAGVATAVVVVNDEPDDPPATAKADPPQRDPDPSFPAGGARRPTTDAAEAGEAAPRAAPEAGPAPKPGSALGGQPVPEAAPALGGEPASESETAPRADLAPKASTTARRPAKPDATPSDPAPTSIDDAALVATVEALRDAKRELQQGQPTKALKTLDALVSAHPKGPMQTERRRLERQAACASKQASRARSAHNALVRAGLADAGDPPCEKNSDTP